MSGQTVRFRIRDLLLATTLLAIYLTGFLYAVQQLAPGELSAERSIIVGAFACHLFVLELCHRVARRKAAPFWLSFESYVPWVPLFVAEAIVMAFAFVPHSTLEGAFFVVSLPFLALVLLAVVHRRAYVSAEGIFCQFMLFTWPLVERVPSERDTLRLRLGPAWWGLVIDIQNEDDRQAIEFVLGDHSGEQSQMS